VNALGEGQTAHALISGSSAWTSSRARGHASLSDPASAPTTLANPRLQQLLADLKAGIDQLERRVPRGKIGTVGFCFGGGIVWNLLQAGEQGLAAQSPSTVRHRPRRFLGRSRWSTQVLKCS
jgi:dienelactone hydrolase